MGQQRPRHQTIGGIQTCWGTEGRERRGAAGRKSLLGAGSGDRLVACAGAAGAQPGPDEPPPPAGDLGATGLGQPAEPGPGTEPGTEPGAEPGTEPGTEGGPLLAPSEPLLPPSGTTAPPVPPAGSVLIDAVALGELFRDQPMYRAGLAAIVQNPPGAAETSAIPDVLADRDAFERLVGDFERYMDQFALDWYRRRERDVYRAFRQQSSTELDLRRRSRRAAIFYLEEFLRDHPDNPSYSPEAMYRLGDLYWEDEDETAGRELRARAFIKTIGSTSACSRASRLRSPRRRLLRPGFLARDDDPRLLR